ncbi:MAG: hypothetical protein KG003_12905 [Bacteroidetes bacterium]|nr:hypothetical protein [Bacteroidota bacterium]
MRYTLLAPKCSSCGKRTLKKNFCVHCGARI